MNKNMKIYTDEIESIVGRRSRKESGHVSKQRSHPMSPFDDLGDNGKVHKKYCRSEYRKYLLSDQY